jgi:soluble lytic murein transglycosylase-like protein
LARGYAVIAVGPIELEVVHTVSVAKRKLITAAAAAGLGLSVVAQATGSPAPVPAKHRAVARHTNRASLRVLAAPGKRFHRSVELASRKAEKAKAARKRARQSAGVAGSTGSTGGLPTPESVGVSSATLNSIAACESGGDPAAVSPDGTYRGKYQFDYGTWASVGGSGDPAAAPEAEQDYRAALLYSQAGSSPWPICGS